MGTLPIVRRVGGINDTVTGYELVKIGQLDFLLIKIMMNDFKNLLN